MPAAKAKTEPAPETTLQKLAAKFPAGSVKKNPKGYHYISIDAMYNRFDEVLGTDWDLHVGDVTLSLVPKEQKTYGRNQNTAFMGTVGVTIVAIIDGKEVSRSGVGADFADDPDKVIKTALANAVKKAGNGFGVGRYLWSAEERAEVDNEVAAQNDTVALKKQVLDIATEQGFTTEGKTKPEITQGLAEHFKVDAGDLASASTLKGLIEANS